MCQYVKFKYGVYGIMLTILANILPNCNTLSISALNNAVFCSFLLTRQVRRATKKLGVVSNCKEKGNVGD